MIYKPSDSLKKRILAYLEDNCTGRNQAITGDKLTDILGIPDRRNLREAIHELREEGNPVLSISSKPAGYFIPQDIAEANEAINELVGRTIELRKVCKGIRAGLEKRFPGAQIKLDIGA